MTPAPFLGVKKNYVRPASIGVANLLQAQRRIPARRFSCKFDSIERKSRIACTKATRLSKEKYAATQ
jgi:hypothetical protein